MQSVVSMFMSEPSVARIRNDLERGVNHLRPSDRPVSIPVDDGLLEHIRRFITRRAMRAHTPEEVDLTAARHECVQSLLIRISPGMRQARAFRETVDDHLNKGIGYGNVRQHSSVHMRLPESVERPTHTVLSSYALSRPVIREDDY